MAKKVIRQILLIYLTTTGIFLTIFFALWYQKLYEELVVLKGTALRENHRNIVISILNSRFTPIDISAKNIAQSTALKFAIFDAKKIIFSNIDFDLRKAKIELKGRGICDNKVFFLASMSADHYFLRHASVEEANTNDGLQILIQGEDVSKDLFGLERKFLVLLLWLFFYWV